MSAVLAFDLGGSALKGCLFDLEGEPLATASVPQHFDEDSAGRSDQGPQAWWSGLIDAAEQIAASAGARFKDVEAVAICGFTRTQAWLDARAQAVRPALGFRDSRAQPCADALLRRAEIAAHPAAAHLNGFHPLSRMLWLAQHEPQAWAATRLVLEPKDYLNLRLTGRPASDPISQFWVLDATRGSPSLAALAGIEPPPLPPLRKPTDVMGRVLDGLPGPLAALAGARVFCGSHDTFAAVAGLGALRPGFAYCISGSSDVFGLLASRHAAADGLITVPWGDAIWQIGGPGQNGANALDWLVDLVGGGSGSRMERLDALLDLPVSRRPLVFHPYLHGERTPYWDRELGASFLGLTAGHGAADLARAVMEGVAFVNRTVLERAERAAGQSAAEIRVAGGGGRNPVWNQLRADILGRPVVASPGREMGLAGCLALARVGLGRDPDLGAAADAIAVGLVRFDPAPQNRSRADALYRVFSDTHAALAEASHRLARIGSTPCGA